MNLSNLDNALWAASLIGHVALVLVLVLRGKVRQFPVFFSFIVFSALVTILLFFVSRFGTKYGYFLAYWATSGANYLFQVVQFVDCKSAFVVAAIPQNRVPDIEIGGIARFRLSGETADRYGTVSSVTGERNERTDAALAAAPVHERDPTATVFISQLKSGKSGTCMVGRTARVLLPVVHLGLLAELHQFAQ